MKKILYTIAIAMTALMTICSCDDYETYADQKARERSTIQNLIAKGDYITRKPIKVISEKDFIANGYKTDLTSNEYVLFESTGVYMQIVNIGCGEMLKTEESATLLCRFSEYNISLDTLVLSNTMYSSTALNVDRMTVNKKGSTYNATFTSGMMSSQYNSTQVPDGWLVPLSYIRLGRPSNETEDDAHVRIIVPHDKGHYLATQGVYACFYDIKYRRGND